MQSTLLRVGRLGRDCDYEGIHFDYESYEQPSAPSTIRPTLFSLEDRISHGGQVPSNRTPIEVYTDGVRFGELSGIRVRLADRFTELYRKYLTNSCTDPENASTSPLAIGPSPATSRDSVSTLQTTADVGK
ncbi:hypothetical protein AVEN_164495-1 [Araneus ventricosus]|uniref:Uncharacterized protein n=1 Tax=Araneus ventricosus TaxID=182803 RepID=A0A4Y2QIR6_ARAVE|nr:hypothetical protein AVEN_164495-1 [Araneus ventricosus]